MNNYLKNIPLFAGLHEQELTQLSRHFIKRNYPKGQILFHKGDEGGNLYIILRGSLKIVLPSSDQEEIILAILTIGEVVGELSFIDGKQRSATVVAAEDTDVLSLKRDDFLKFLSNNFNAVRKIFEILAGRLRDTDDTLEEAYFFDLPARIARKLLSLARQFGAWDHDRISIKVRLTQRDIAAMAGTTRESVNKQLRILRQKGLIKYDGGYLTILDPARIARRARASFDLFL